MRLPWLFAALTCAVVCAAGEPPKALYPPWDGHESIEQYAKRVNLPTTKTLDLGNGVNLELVLIPAGKFIMGTPEPESPWIGGTVLGMAGLIVLVLVARLLWRSLRQRRRPQFSLRWLIIVVLILGVAQYGGFRCWRAVQASDNSYPDESPEHAVTLTRAFYLGKFEVTQEQYMQVMGTNPSSFKGASLPVELVLWADAQEFCEKVSAKTGQTVRLPTEAEWEFACRAGTTTMYCTGDVEAYVGRGSIFGGRSGPPAAKGPNAFGLDMLGNPYEWCEDWYGEYQPDPVTDPKGAAMGTFRVRRGGSSGFYYQTPCRSADRGRLGGSYRSDNTGFRVVVSVAPTAP